MYAILTPSERIYLKSLHLQLDTAYATPDEFGADSE